MVTRGHIGRVHQWRSHRLAESGEATLARGDVSRCREVTAVSRSPVLSPSRQTLFLLAVLLAYPVQVSAADDEASSPPVSLPPVLVTTPTRLPTPQSEVASSITVIPSEEIERKQERTLPDALVRDHERWQVSWLADPCLAPPSQLPSGVIGARLAAYSCGGSHGIGLAFRRQRPTVFPFDPRREPSAS